MQKCERKLCRLYSKPLLFDLLIISPSLQGEDRVKQNQTDLFSGNYAAHRYSITNSCGPLDSFLNHDSSSLCHRSSFTAINLPALYCRCVTDIAMLKLLMISRTFLR